LENRVRLVRRTFAATFAATLLVAAPAAAGEVIVVDGNQAARVSDPTVPSRAEISLGSPEGGRATLGLATAASARTARTEARAARAWRVARSAAGRRRAQRAVYGSLTRALRARGIAETDQRRWRRWYVLSLRTLGKLTGARDTQLRYVVDSVEALALGRQLIPSRMRAAFLQLERNRQYWRALPYPAAGDQVSFRGSQILFQYFPGEGLQIHPLSTFKKANALHGFCARGEAACDEQALRTVLDEMTYLAVDRGRGFIAWEYLFAFGGGVPPWMSGMAQATGIQALGRAAASLSQPAYAETARRALGAFETPPPTGVRTTGPRGGVHYLQYSFAPGLYIFNAFLQSLIGLYDFSHLTGDARSQRLYQEAEPEARAEVPLSDVGDWSRYSYAGAESTGDYHELLREFLQSMCSRRIGPLYCDYATRYRGYQVDPPELSFAGPAAAAARELTSIRFTVSKLSAVEVKVYKGTQLAFQRLATFSRGSGSFAWRPSSPGLYSVQLGAKELRTGLGKKDRAAGEIAVE
jgi:D-glucuronyl C5-epimerase C-terminus